MKGAPGDIDGLPLLQDDFVRVQRQQGLAGDDQPVLVPVPVPLKAEALSGIDDDSFHLVLGILQKDVEISPGTLVSRLRVHGLIHPSLTCLPVNMGPVL